MNVITMKNFIITVGFFALNSCVSSSAWIVEQQIDSGIIGYKMGNNNSAEEDLDQLFDSVGKEICGSRNWQIVRDTLRRDQKTSTYVIPQTSTSNSQYTFTTSSNTYGNSRDTVHGTHSTTTYVPVTRSYTEYWREAEIVCKGVRFTGGGAEFSEDEKFKLGVLVDTSFTGQGVKVYEVLPHSAAARVGIKVGDIITEIGYVRVKNINEMNNILRSMSHETSLKYCRGDACVTKEVKLGDAH